MAEKVMVTERFSKFRADEPVCLQIDAAMTVQFDSLFNSLVVTGYLQTMSPSYFKVIGLNPLAQPLLILSSDGRSFCYLIVPEARTYEGDTDSETYKKYAPKGFYPEYAYYWLTGRLQPGEILLDEIAVDLDGRGFWIDFSFNNEKSKRKILYNPDQNVIYRHLLYDSSDTLVLDVSYDKHSGECRIPTKINISSPNANGSMEIRLQDIITESKFTARDFQISPPKHYLREEVQ